MEKAEASRPAAKKASHKRAETTRFTPADTDQDPLMASFRMGRRAWARLATLLVFLVATIAAFLQAPRPWQEVFEPKAGMSGLLDDLYYPIERNPHLRLPFVPVDINTVTFLKDGRTGWIAGDSGYIAKTTDGGLTWERQKIGEAPIRQAGALGWPGLIGEAHAAEAPIQQIAPEQKAIRETKPAPTKSTSRAKAESKPFAKPSPPIEPAIDPRRADLHSIAFANAKHGVAVGEGGTILRTGDGGTSWVASSSGTLAWLTSVYLTDANMGFAVGDQGTILRTEDSGYTWVSTATSAYRLLHAVHFSDKQHGVAVGARGNIFHTEDGGFTWKDTNSGTIEALSSVNLTDPGHGVAVGSGGAILRTEDGGINWTRIHVGGITWIRSVCFANAKL